MTYHTHKTGLISNWFGKNIITYHTHTNKVFFRLVTAFPCVSTCTASSCVTSSSNTSSSSSLIESSCDGITLERNDIAFIALVLLSSLQFLFLLTSINSLATLNYKCQSTAQRERLLNRFAQQKILKKKKGQSEGQQLPVDAHTQTDDYPPHTEMSNYHSRHLSTTSNARCSLLNSDPSFSSRFNVTLQTYSNRFQGADPQFNKVILPQLLKLIKSNLGHFYNTHGSFLYGYDDSSPNAWHNHKWQEMLEREMVYIIIYARDSSSIIGFLSLMCTESDSVPDSEHQSSNKSYCPTLFLYEIHIVPDERSKGLGSFLITHLLIPLARALEYPSIDLCVFAENTCALSWYHRMGFQEYARYCEGQLIGMTIHVEN